MPGVVCSPQQQYAHPEQKQYVSLWLTQNCITMYAPLGPNGDPPQQQLPLVPPPGPHI
jgi:hypothetical protein